MGRGLRWLMAMSVFLCMFGCGGGESGSVSGAPSTGDNTGAIESPDSSGGTEGTANVAVYFPAAVQTMSVRAGTLPTVADHARLVIKKVETRIEQRIVGWEGDEEDSTPIYADVEVTGETARIIADGAIPGYVSAAVPPGTNYTIEILTYDKDAVAFGAGINYMLQYAGPIPFDVLPAQSVEISLAENPLQPLSISLVFPEPFNLAKSGTGIVSGGTYTLPIAAKGPLASALRPDCFYAVTADGFGGVVSYNAAAGDKLQVNQYTFVAPVKTELNPNDPEGRWMLEFQGQFFIADGLLKKTGEKWQNWVTNPRCWYELTPLGTIQITE